VPSKTPRTSPEGTLKPQLKTLRNLCECLFFPLVAFLVGEEDHVKGVSRKAWQSSTPLENRPSNLASRCQWRSLEGIPILRLTRKPSSTLVTYHCLLVVVIVCSAKKQKLPSLFT